MPDLKPCPDCGKLFCGMQPNGRTDAQPKWNTRHGEKVYRVKPMRWELDGSVWVGNSNQYLVWLKSNGDYVWRSVEDTSTDTCNSLEHGKQLAEAHRLERLLPELEEVER
jgi:hypothetical protein